MTMRTLTQAIAISVLAGAAVLPGAAQAENRDINCSMIKKTENGKFTYSSNPGFSILRLTAPDGPMPSDIIPENVVGFACVRQNIVPDENDIEVLQAGYSLTLADTKETFRTMQLSLVDGKIAYEISGGTLSKKETKKLDKVIAKMQARIAA
jgi:hypothetical protein